MTNESVSTSSFRDLYQQARDYQGDRLYEDVLLPSLHMGKEILDSLVSFGQMNGAPDNEQERLYGLWDLYALSRINDFLLLSFQSRLTYQSRSENSWDGPLVTAQEYLDFFQHLGFTSFAPNPADAFSSYHHEIIQVEQSSNRAEVISIGVSAWPGLRFNDLLFSRSGVEVCGGTDHVNKYVAESSTLYFTFRRLRRPTNDLSIGWGSNSQWRTAFRRDYECDGQLFYNIDGKTALSFDSITAETDRDGLTPQERLELCKNRSFIITTKPHSDLWPYDDRYCEKATGLS